MVGFLSLALKSSRMEQNTKLKSIESKTILACSYIFIFILINATLIAFISMNKKDSLLKTMLYHAYALSSTKEAFNEECAKLRSIFSGLDFNRIMNNSEKNGRNN